MTMPGGSDPTAQILLKLGEMGIQLAVITEQLKPVTDHETRIRSLERFRWMLVGACGGVSGLTGYLLGHVR
jgi:hypothetical protein